MRKLLALFVALGFCQSAQASVLLDGTNDRLTGTLTGNYGDPLTIAVKIKIANHPVSGQAIINVGNTSTTSNDSYQCRVSSVDNKLSATSENSAGTQSSATDFGFVDDTWISVICTFVSDTSRTVRTEATSGSNTTSRVVADLINDIRIGETLSGSGDFAGLVAEVAIWDVNIATVDDDAYVANECTANIDPTNLIAYWALVDDANDFTNEGLDSGGDLTAAGNAVIDADHPPMGSCGATPTFTAGPTAGTKTQTTIPFTFTSDTSGTVKGVACPDGQAAPTVAQVVAGNCTGGVGAVATISTAVIATNGASGTFSALTANTTYDTHFAIDATTDSAAISSVANQTTIAVPTFTSGPAAGTHTSTTLVITFTSSQTSTVYGVACPDGQSAPTVTQVLAGNCTGNVAAQSAFNEAVVATVGDGDTFLSLAPSTQYDTHYAQSNAAGNSSAISTLANQNTAAGGGGAFTVNPTVTSQTEVAYTIGGTTGAAVTVSAVACAKDSTAPTIAQVVVADCTGNVNALAAVSESWNGADSFVLGTALPFPIYDIYVTDGATLITRADEVLDIPSGKQRLTLTSVHATSPYFGQGVAASDICTIDLVTDPDSYVITDSVDGTVDYAAGGGLSRQLVDSTCYDISSPQNIVFLLVFNNLPPSVLISADAGEVFFAGALFQVQTNPNFDLSAHSEDPEGDDIDFSVVAGALPDDWVLNTETGAITDGTPGDCEDYSFTIELVDIYDSTTEVADTVTIGDVIPDPTGMTPAEFIAALAADFCD